MQHSNDFSNLVTAIVIIITFFLSALFVKVHQKVKEAPKRKLTQTPAQAYAKMVHAIADATTPRQLDIVSGMITGFRLEFTGYLSEKELNDYCNDVTDLKKEKRFDLLRELRSQALQIV